MLCILIYIDAMKKNIQQNIIFENEYSIFISFYEIIKIKTCNIVMKIINEFIYS